MYEKIICPNCQFKFSQRVKADKIDTGISKMENRELQQIREATLNQSFDDVKDAVDYFYFAVDRWLKGGRSWKKRQKR